MVGLESHGVVAGIAIEEEEVGVKSSWVVLLVMAE